MTAERDHWRNLAQQRSTQLQGALVEIARLRDELATQRDDTALLGGDSGLINNLRDQRDQYRRERDDARVDLAATVKRYQQLEIIYNPNRFNIDVDEWLELPADQQKQMSVRTFKSETALLTVGYMIVARHPDRDEPYVQYGGSFYPGTIDNLNSDLRRIPPIIWRAPMPDDLRGDRMEQYGVSAERQLAAIQELVMYVYDPLLKESFEQQFDTVFKGMLEPHCKPGTTDAARAAFRRSAKATYEKLSDNRNVQIDLPKLQAGRKVRAT